MALAAFLPLIGTIIEKFIPDPQQAAEAKLKALDMAQKGELAALDAEVRLALGQLEVNRVEAATDAFRGGWRPAAGWACSIGLGYEFLLRPLLPWLVQVAGGDVPPLPPIDSDTLLTLLLGMLGLGGLRSYEKVKGAAK